VRGITHLGGTIIGTTNRGNPLRYPVKQFDGTVQEVDRSDELVRAFQLHQLDALISVGGDGSMQIAHALSQKGLWVVGVPKTIDNDLDARDHIRSRHRLIVHHRMPGPPAFHCRLAPPGDDCRSDGPLCRLDRPGERISGSADVILIPEIPYDLHKVVEKIKAREDLGRDFSIVVVAEGAKRWVVKSL